MRVLDSSPGTVICFKDLVPDLKSSYYIPGITASAVTHFRFCSAGNPDCLEFDCNDFSDAPRGFLPWCLMRCVDIALQVKINKITVLSTKETVQSILPVLSVARKIVS